MRAIGALRIVALPLALMAAAPAGGRSDAEKAAPVDVVNQAELENLPVNRNIRQVLDAVSPFTLACRADIRLPADLGLQAESHYSFLSAVLPKDLEPALPTNVRSLIEAFPVAGGAGGYQVSVGGGANPVVTYQALEKLLKSGKIHDLESDPCREFFPEPGAAGPAACTPQEKTFDEKAIRVQGSVGGSLGGKGLVLVSPVSPLPFYDPGPLPGDEQPPRYAVTGEDGSYNLSLGGLYGPIELSGSSGCDSYTTVQIAEGGPPPTGDGGGIAPTQARGAPPPQTATPPPPKPASKAPPPEGMKLCGPDVTDYVLGTLDFLNQTFNSWDEATKNQKCTDLFNPLKADGAWEMRLFSPYDQEIGSDKKVKPGTPRFFQRFTKLCARPQPCDATVEFLGHCIHAQIVNYVVWGAMNRLCDTENLGGFMHTARDFAIQLLWNRSLSASQTYYAQGHMSYVGKLFIEDGSGLASKKKSLKGFIDEAWRSSPEMAAALEGNDCTCACGQYDTSNLENLDWGFRWGIEDWYDRRGSALRKP